MGSLRFWGTAFFAFAATGSLFGCGGQQVSAGPPVGVTGARPASDASLLAHGAGRKLLYVVSNTSVNVYTYPHDSLLGSLTSSGSYVCADQKDDVFVTTGDGLTVSEYAHGSVVPKVTLQDPLYAGPCFVDPTTGNVAVAGLYSNTVVIFPHNKRNGWRFAKTYQIPNMHYARFCSYDPKGNLFIDGFPYGSGNFVLDELPKGDSSPETISLDQRITGPGGLQWVGNYLAVTDAGPLLNSPVVIYQFSISGSTGTKVGTTKLTDSYGGAQYWIQADRAIGQYKNVKYVNGVAVWAYPSGGNPLKTFAPQTYAASVVVSLP